MYTNKTLGCEQFINMSDYPKTISQVATTNVEHF